MKTCDRCGKPHVFLANSKRLAIKCDGEYKRKISGRTLITKCGKQIINDGFVPQPKPIVPRLKIKDMKTGEQQDLKGKA